MYGTELSFPGGGGVGWGIKRLRLNSWGQPCKSRNSPQERWRRECWQGGMGREEFKGWFAAIFCRMVSSFLLRCMIWRLWHWQKMRGQDAKIFTPSEQNEQDMSTTEGQLDGFGDGVGEAEGWCMYWKMELPGRMKRLRPQRFMDGVQKVVATKDATDWGTRRTWRKISIFWKKKSDAKLRMEICCVTAAKMKTQPTMKWLKWNRTGQQNRIQQNKSNYIVANWNRAHVKVLYVVGTVTQCK